MSTLLRNVITAHRCTSTHHFIVMEAISLLEGPDADRWHDLLLTEHMSLLQGAKAPDAEFKDFRNHVLHVGEGEWGGARNAAAEWYGKAVAALREEKWSKAAYALGVLSHYYSDPLQPFHTGQTEEEGSIHRAVEWSIAKSRDEIVRRIEAKGYPDLEVGSGPGFVSDMVLAGAKRSHPHYQTFIDHYDIHAGAKNPPAGLDDTMLDAIADLCAHATKGIAILFDRAIAEAKAAPKKVNLSLHGYLATLDIPLRWVTKKLADEGDRRTVAAMYKELQETGKVIRKLPDDDKAIRKLHAHDVLRVPLKELDARPAAPTGTKHTPRVEQPAAGKPVAAETPAPAKAPPKAPAIETPEPEIEPAPFTTEPETPDADEIELKSIMAEIEHEAETRPAPRIVMDNAEPEMPEDTEAEPVTAEADPGMDDDFDDEDELDSVAAIDVPDIPEEDRLTRASDVIDAPSIGPKTAERLNAVGIYTIGDLLDASAEETSDELDARHLTEDVVRNWQDQTRLMMAMPSLRVHDVQILVGVGIRSKDQLAAASARELLDASIEFAATPAARRIIKDKEPNADEVGEWIGLAKAG